MMPSSAVADRSAATVGTASLLHAAPHAPAAHPARRLPARRAAAWSALSATLLALLLPITPVEAAAPNTPNTPTMGVAPRTKAPRAATSNTAALAPTEPTIADDGSDEAFRAQAEADVLRKVGASARREGLRLMLFVDEGRPIMLDSQRPEPDDGGQTPYVDFRLDGLSPDQAFYIVRATLAFGNEVLWISRKDGERYEMHGNAHPSPDGRFLVVTHASPGVEFNGVVIWARDGDRLVERYKFQLAPEQQTVSFRFMRWRDGNTIELEQFAEVDPQTCATGTLASLALLSRKADRWILRSNSSPRCES